MIKGKKQILLLSILGVTTLLVVIIGATYAYFTTSMTGRNGTINTTTAKIGAASFTAESVSIDKVLPGWTSGEKNVTVTLEPSDYDVKYTCTLKMTSNPLTDLTLTVAGTNALTSVNGKLKSGVSDTIIASGTLKASQTKQSVSMTYTLSFQETGVDQNTQQGKTITGLVTCSTEGQTVYYNSDNPNGTTTNPTGTNSISLQEAMLRDNPTIKTRTNFSERFTEETTGTIFQTNKTEDGSTVYYYAGNTTNNWVKFTYQSKRTTRAAEIEYPWKTMYWRIIRTNEDGSIRLLYFGESIDSSEPYISAYEGEEYVSTTGGSFNVLADDDPLYVGYMYGTSGTLENNRTNETPSLIKKSIDFWYLSKFLGSAVKEFVSNDAIYCNDRSKGEIYEENIYTFGGNVRLEINGTPTHKCGGDGNGGLFESTQALGDKFNSSGSNGGNGQLKCSYEGYTTENCPVALMTIDEAMFIGISESASSKDEDLWINKNTSGLIDNLYFWTMTPDLYEGMSRNYVLTNSEYKGYSINSVDNWAQVRPVLSLKSCVNVTGTGTPDDPYVVDYDNSCN